MIFYHLDLAHSVRVHGKHENSGSHIIWMNDKRSMQSICLCS